MKKKITKPTKPFIDYKNGLIAVLIILALFTAGQLATGIPMVITVMNKTYTKLLGSIFLIIFYIDCFLAIIVGVILGFRFSLKSIKNSQSKILGYITLGVTIFSLVALLIPPIVLGFSLLPR